MESRLYILKWKAYFTCVNRISDSPIRTFSWKLLFGLALYTAGLVVFNWLQSGIASQKWLLFLLPTLPLLYIATVIVRQVGTMDEMLRKITLEGMAFSGLATGFTCFSFLFIGDLNGRPVPAEWAFYLMWIYYGIGVFLSSRRYR